jgi:eukaryotic-like serine/threonine-protein kinase
VYALSASTGTSLWKYTTGNFVRSSPAVAGGVVYVGSWDHNLYAFHLPNQ